MAARLWDDPRDEERIAQQFELRRQQNRARQLDESTAARAASIRRQAQLGTASLALAKAGRDGNDPLVQKAALAAAHAREKRGFGLHSIGDVLKGTARVTFTALETPLSELQSVIRGAGFGGATARGRGATPFVSGQYWRDVAAGIGASGRSVGWKAIEDLWQGDKVDLGTGFFAGGEIREEQKRDSERLSVNGRAITTGRVVASRVVEPGTRPYNVMSGLLDASVAIGADPTNVVLGGVAQARQARKLFVTKGDTAGLVAGARKTVITERVDGWLAGDGQKVLEKLADTNDTYDVWRLLGRKVEPGVAASLADARDTGEVQSILRPLLGVELREKPQVPGLLREAVNTGASAAFQVVTRRNPASIRLAQVMPGGAFHLDDDAQAVTQMERFLRNARMDEKTVAKYVDKLARATTPTEKYNVIVTDMLSEVMTTLSGSAGSRKAQQLTTVWKNNYRELSKYFVDEIGENVGLKEVTIAGRQFQVPTPHLYTEYINGVIPSPDARAIRRLTSGNADGAVPSKLWFKAVNSKGWEATTNVLDFLSQDVWKPLALLRGAWTVRVVGEEQVRMAAAGLDSVVSHPLRAIAWATGRAERGSLDVLGQGWDALDDASDFAKSQSNRGGGWRNRIVSHGKTVVNRNDDFDRYVQGWQGELGQLANDPVARAVAGGPPAGSVPVSAARRPEGVPDNEGFNRAWDVFVDKGSDIDHVDRSFLIERGIAGNDYIHEPEYVVENIDDLLSAADELVDARTANNLEEASDLSRERVLMARRFRATLKQLKRSIDESVDDFDPDYAPLPANPVEAAKQWFWEGKGSKFRREMAEASGREDLLTREGANAYIDSVRERIRIKTGDDPRLIDAIATNRLGGQRLDDISVRTELGAIADEGVGPEFAKADITLAGRPTAGSKVGEYLNQATDFLFTNLMSKETNWLSRSPAFRQFYYQRLVELVPFMDDAAKQAAIWGARGAGLDDVAKRMEKMVGRGVGDLTLEEADIVAKGFGLDSTKKLLFDLSEKSQAADIARIIFPFAEAWREILTNWTRIGIENPIALRRGQQAIEGARGAGWFSKNEATGEEVFNYPGTGFLSKKLFGVEAPLQGSVAALNLFSNNPFIPGFGPVVQVTVGKLIPDKPQWDMVRDVVTPFGDADTGDGYIESFLPAWIQKWRTAMDDPESDRQFANTVMDVARYLVSTGEYSTATPKEQERLSAAAVQKARAMYLFRGAAQFFAPSAPRPEMMAYDKEGNLVTAFKLTEEFRKLQDEDYESAVQRFLDTYGEQALLYMQPKSRGGFTPTDDLHEWVRENPKLASRYSETYGFFAPGGGEFNMTEMDRQIAVGEREALTPTEAVNLANARVASAKYRAARDRVGPRPSAAEKAWLRQVRDALVSEYPGYEPDKVELGTVETKIRELYRAVDEPTIAETDTGKALRKYLAARDKAVQVAQQRGLAGFGRANSMRSTRAWLRDVAEALTAEHPDFLPLWERVLEREMVDDSAQEAGVA